MKIKNVKHRKIMFHLPKKWLLTVFIILLIFTIIRIDLHVRFLLVCFLILLLTITFFTLSRMIPRSIEILKEILWFII